MTEQVQQEAAKEYTIDELAAASRVPSRTIRFYQSEGVLPKPQIRGRVAYYGPAHLERLALVADLQDRGLTMKAIADLLQKIDRGELDLNEWLGLEAQLGAPWVEDTPQVLDEAELYERIGGKRPGVLAELVRLKLVRREADALLIPSPGLLQIAMRLGSAGVDLETAAKSAQIIRKHASRAAKDLTQYFFEQTGAEDLEEAFRTLRATGQEALRLIFGQEMERASRALLASGKAIRKRKKQKNR
jgi:DNA-binding transcriptional MerR regulator